MVEPLSHSILAVGMFTLGVSALIYAELSPDELADHKRQVAKISATLTKYASLGE